MSTMPRNRISSLCRSAIQKHSVGILFFVVALCYFIWNIPESLSLSTEPWTFFYYIPDYQTMGFAPRAFLGSVVSLFFPFKSETVVLHISVAVTIVLILVMALLLDYVCTRSKESKIVLPFFILLTIFVPINTFYFLSSGFIGIIDSYFLILSLVCIVLADKQRLCWCIPFLCGICMAMYEGYIFAYFPVIFIVLFYSFCVKKQKTSAAVLIVALFVVLVTFIYFLFLFRLYRDAILPIPDRQQLRNALSQKTNLELSEVFDHYYYSSYSAAYDDRLLPEEIIAIRQSSLLKSLPSAIVCVCASSMLWVRSFRHAVQPNLRLVYVFCLLSPIAEIPFLHFSQQCKYISYLLFSQIILIGYLACKEPSFSETLSDVIDKCKRKPGWFLFPFCIILLFRALQAY